MEETFSEKLKKIEKEYPAFFAKPNKGLINYISVKTSPQGEILYKSKLIVIGDLPKEIKDKVEILLS